MLLDMWELRWLLTPLLLLLLMVPPPCRQWRRIGVKRLRLVRGWELELKPDSKRPWHGLFFIPNTSLCFSWLQRQVWKWWLGLAAVTANKGMRKRNR